MIFPLLQSRRFVSTTRSGVVYSSAKVAISPENPMQPQLVAPLAAPNLEDQGPPLSYHDIHPIDEVPIFLQRMSDLLINACEDSFDFLRAKNYNPDSPIRDFVFEKLKSMQKLRRAFVTKREEFYTQHNIPLPETNTILVPGPKMCRTMESGSYWSTMAPTPEPSGSVDGGAVVIHSVLESFSIPFMNEFFSFFSFFHFYMLKDILLVYSFYKFIKQLINCLMNLFHQFSHFLFVIIKNFHHFIMTITNRLTRFTLNQNIQSKSRSMQSPLTFHRIHNIFNKFRTLVKYPNWVFDKTLVQSEANFTSFRIF